MSGSGHGVSIRVDHVGIAVRSVADAEPVLAALGCEKLSDEAVTEDGSVPHETAGEDARFRWAYYELGDASRLELIAPLAGGGFIEAFLDRNGPGLHHVTLEVADLDSVADHLQEAGFDVVDRRAYDTWTEAFVSPRNPTGALFQLMEYHDGYAATADRLPPDDLFVNGHPVEEVDR